jgi:D-threo-aldose 1-dehydrogenase
LVAGRYTLLDQSALDTLLPRCAARGIGVMAAAAFNSGLLADPSAGATFNYTSAPPERIERALAIKAVCDGHGVPLLAAAIQFPLGHPAVQAVVIGARSPEEVDADTDAFEAPVPAALWAELKDRGLIPPEVPTP